MNINNFVNRRALRVFLKYFLALIAPLIAIYFAVVVWRMVHFFNLDKTNAQVERIHNARISMADVMGENLPLDPKNDANTTIAGIDANKNGIRDDVELAIFNKYPNSAKVRAPLLQYALALEQEVNQKIVNMAIVTETVTEQSRAGRCLSNELVPRVSPESPRSDADMEKIYEYIDFVKDKQFNTRERVTARENFLKDLGSFGQSTNSECDINSALLPG